VRLDPATMEERIAELERRQVQADNRDAVLGQVVGRMAGLGRRVTALEGSAQAGDRDLAEILARLTILETVAGLGTVTVEPAPVPKPEPEPGGDGDF
jgi:hypothetical protein